MLRIGLDSIFHTSPLYSASTWERLSQDRMLPNKTHSAIATRAFRAQGSVKWTSFSEESQSLISCYESKGNYFQQQQQQQGKKPRKRMQCVWLFCWLFYFAIITQSSIVVTRQDFPTEIQLHRIILKTNKDPETIFGDNNVIKPHRNRKFFVMWIFRTFFNYIKKTYLLTIRRV